MNKALAALAAWLLAALASAQAAPEQVTWTRNVSWPEGELRLEVRTVVQPPLSPATRFQAERRVAETLPSLYIAAVQDLLVDSQHTVGDRLAASDELFRALADQASAKTGPFSSSFTPDLHAVEMEYRFPLYDPSGAGLIAPFVRHELPIPVRRVLGFVPARTFTGVVILAQGDFPVHGKDTRAKVRPALLPRLFDEQMNPVLAPEMCAPESLRKWGVAAYSYSGSEEELRKREERIGLNPLRTRARAVFGIHATDLLLSGEAARQLLSRPQNRELLVQGRILIILDPPER